MARALLQVVLNAVALLITAYLVPGVEYAGGIGMLLLAGLVFGLLNLLIKPIVTVLSLPAIVLTLGLFFLVINGAMLWLAAGLVPGLEVTGCFPAILGGLVLAVFNWIVRAFERK
ncbi:MAG: phage holin family protein [Thermoanaerobaculia bacterium]|nr:phage holin family protein [Thermoanaerobaculia bacterium]